MKKFVVLFFLLTSVSCLLSSAFAQSKKVIKNNKIKSITETVTETVNGKETTRKDSYTSYDKNANITAKEDYRKDGTLKHKETAKYDSNGNKLEETMYDAAETQLNPEKNTKHVSKYNMDDNKTEELEYDASGKLVSKTQYSYNGKGEKILEVTFDALGKLIKKVVYTYDSKGLRVEKKEYDAALRECLASLKEDG